MSNRYQIIVLRKGLTVALFAVNIFGLWSFKFVHGKKSIKYSFVKAMYSIFLLCSVLCACATVGKMSFMEDGTIFYGSFTLRLVLVTYGYSVLVFFVVAYIDQHYWTREIETIYIKCKDIEDTMNNSFWNVNFSSYLVEMILKTVIYDIIFVVVAFNNMTNSSDVIKAKPFFTIILSMPLMLGRFHVNVFYGAILALSIYLKKLNGNLNYISNKAVDLNKNNRTNHNYCYLSDEIDKLSTMYFKLADATKSLNSIFSLPLMLWNTTTLLSLTVQLLYQCVSMMELIQERKESTVMLYLFGYFSMLLSAIDLLTTTNACQRIANSVSLVNRDRN